MARLDSSLFRRLWQSSKFDGERSRQARGVRGPLDWYVNGRLYASVAMGLLIGLAGGVQLTVAGPWWLRLLGAVVLVPFAWLTWWTIRWLLRPVDPQAAAALDAEYRRSPVMRWWRSPDKPPPGFLTVGLQSPWVQPDPKLAGELADEASREITSGHPLFGQELTCRARCEGCNLLVFGCHDGTWAIVRLTGQHRQPPPQPETVRFDSYAALETAMQQHKH